MNVTVKSDNRRSNSRIVVLIVFLCVTIGLVGLIGKIGLDSYQEQKRLVALQEEQAEQVKDEESLSAMLARWDDAVKVASQTPRIALSDRISELQGIRREAESLKMTSECMYDVKNALVRTMDKRINGFLSFMGSKDDSEVQDAMSASSRAQDEFIRNLEVCRDIQT